MLAYENFKNEVEEKIRDFFPEEYKDVQIESKVIQKVNVELDALLFKKENMNAGPTIYINNMYKTYLEDENFDSVMAKTAAMVVNAFDTASRYSSLDLGAVKDNVYFCLINKEKNKELLKEIPHRDFLDLAIVYHWSVDENASSLITNSLVKEINLSEEELYESAYVNTRHLTGGVCVKTMYEVVKELYSQMNEEIDVEEEDMGIPMYVISNKKSFLGAQMLLYSDVLNDVANILDCDLYVLPSSIHECIAVPAISDVEELASMVGTVNEACWKLQNSFRIPCITTAVKRVK